MKIRRLDLLSFGPFTNRSLDLSAGNPGLHVILGPNEAGKSSTLRALKAWLFGIDARSPDNFIHDYKQLRVGGIIETAEGQQICCIRRKGNKDTLLDASTEEPIGDNVLSNLLPGLDEKLFSQLHGIDYQGLVQGGQAILDQSGDIGKSLFGAALGSKGKADLLGELAAEADKLFRARGQNQIINAAAANLKEARRQERQESVSVRNWKDLQKALKEAEQEITRIDNELAAARRSKSKLERFNRVAAPLSERRELLNLLADQAQVVMLPEDFGSRRQTAIDRLAQAQIRHQKSTAKLEKLQQEASTLNVPQGLLDHQEEIEDLQLQLGAVQKSTKDKPAQDAKRRDRRNAAQDLLAGIRPDLTLETVSNLKPILNRKRLITTLAQDWSLLQQKIGLLDTKLRELADDKSHLEQELNALASPHWDVSALQSAILNARRAGDLTTMLRAARNSQNEQEAVCLRDLSRLGRFDGSLQDLSRCCMPEGAVLERFERRFDALEEQMRLFNRRKDEAMDILSTSEANLKILLRSSNIPTLQELHKAREHRDQGWRLIRRQYIDSGETDLNQKAIPRNNDLTISYEQSVLDADTVADKLRLDAQRVQERLALEEQIEASAKQIADHERKLCELATIRTQLEAEWQAVWQGIADQIGSPREMKEWLQRVQQLLQKISQLEKARAAADSLQTIQATHDKTLTTELQKLGYDQEQKSGDLETLLIRCEQIADKQQTSKRRQEEIRTALQKNELQLKNTGENLLHAKDHQQQWRLSWAEAVDGLGIGAQPHPELALETMAKLEELFQELREADIAQKRMYGMDKDEERFADAVVHLAGRVGIEKAEPNPAEVTRALVRQLARARADAATLNKLRSQISELEHEVAEALQDIRITEETCAALRAEAGVASDEELASVQESSSSKRQLIRRLQELEQNLHQFGEGHSIAELEAEALDLDADQASDLLVQIETRLTDLSSERDTNRDTRKALLVQIQTLDGSSKAAEAAELAEQLLAGIVPEAEQYLR